MPKLAKQDIGCSFRVHKTDAYKRIVYGEVYAPNEIDSHGAIMLAEDIEKMAHRFMKLALDVSIDKNHDNVPVGAYPVESYIAKAEDPDYSEGAWVLAVKIDDDETWEQVLNGELNGFSLQALVMKGTALVEIEVYKHNFGYTESADGHDHAFVVELDTLGKVVKGYTSEDNGHRHVITTASITDRAASHTHKFFLE